MSANDNSSAGFPYKGNLEDLGEILPDDPHFIPMVTVYGLTFIVGFIGNITVVVAVLGDKRNRNITAILMVSLAFADLLFLIVCLPYETSREFTSTWDGGDALCKVSGFAEMLSASATIINLTTIGVERYVVIVYSSSRPFSCPNFRSRKIIIAVWISAAFVSLPNLFVMTTESLHMYNNVSSRVIYLCGETVIPYNHHIYYASYKLLVMLVVPAFVMCYCYFRIIHSLWTSTKQLSRIPSHNGLFQRDCTMTQSGTGDKLSPQCSIKNSGAIKSRKQVIKMLVTVIVVFILCWGPKLVFRVMRKMRLTIVYQPAAYTVKIVLNCLPYIQSCLNPFIYGLMSQNFRRSLRYVFLMRLQKRIYWKQLIICRRSSTNRQSSNSDSKSHSNVSSHKRSKGKFNVDRKYDLVFCDDASLCIRQNVNASYKVHSF